MYKPPPKDIDADPFARNDTYREPPLTCDVVMKGGITSGIVYPRAICQLARRYKLRNIGGASAGAIGAVAAAAAEYGRTRKGAGGFGRLYRIPAELDGRTEAPNGDTTTVLGLFRPEPETKRVFDVAFAFVGSKVRGALAIPRKFPRFPLIGLALALLAIGLAVWWDLEPAVAVGVVAFAIVLAVVGAVVETVRTALSVIPRNDFGLVRGGPPRGGGGATPLTVWLYEILQDLAGKQNGTPLTFANLWGVGDDAEDGGPAEPATRSAEIIRLGQNPRDREINLEVITTNLTQSRPLRLPIPLDRNTADPVEANGLLIKLDDWRPFFPKAVIRHLQDHAPPPNQDIADDVRRADPEGEYRHLATPELPIIVAARLSLSFPVLMSALPLYRLRDREGGRTTLEKLWFSDGGISSNFPVHFFDRPLPTRPTFALDLTGFDPGDKGIPKDPGHSVRAPDEIEEPRPWTTWKSIDNLFDFAVAIKDALENWRDNAQARLPGFRDRIVHVRIGRGEGGLNLAMDPQKVCELAERGSFAGDLLVTLFSGDPDEPPEPAKRWNDHRFARYRVAMSAIERFLRSYGSSYDTAPDAATISYSQRIQDGLTAPCAFPSPELRAFAEATTQTYRDLVNFWEGHRPDLCTPPGPGGEPRSLADEGVPTPPAVLRVIPPV